MRDVHMNDEMKINDEEKEMIEWHKKYDNRIQAIIELANQIMQVNDKDRMLKLFLILQKEEEENEKMFTESARLLFLHQASSIFIKEYKGNVQQTIFHICKNYEEIIFILRKLRFSFWRIFYLNEPEESLANFIREKQISIYALYDMMCCSFENKAEGMEVLEKVVQGNREWMEYLNEKKMEISYER